jgi:hypothetical protein
MVVPGVEALGLRLHQLHLMQVQVPLSLIELELLLLQHLVEAEGVLGTGIVCLHLVMVLLLSSLNFRPFSIKVGADLDQGLLRDVGLLLWRSEGFLPLRQLLRPCKEPLL